jgi:ABC-2 type transport system ATP-binding protein
MLEVTLRSGMIVEALELLRKEPWVDECSVFGTTLHVLVRDESRGRDSVMNIFSRNGLEVGQITRIIPSLEDVFLYLLERDANSAAA